jgi:hypothetical protein
MSLFVRNRTQLPYTVQGDTVYLILVMLIAPPVSKEAPVAARTRDGVAGRLKWTVTVAGAVLTGVVAVLFRSKRDQRIRYTYDPESKNWSFEVPSLGIVGGAETREEAERQAAEAIDFTERHNRSATV